MLTAVDQLAKGTMAVIHEIAFCQEERGSGRRPERTGWALSSWIERKRAENELKEAELT